MEIMFLFLGAIAGYMAGFCSGGYMSEHWRQRYWDKVPMFSKQQYKSIAKRLEIEADGGDNPAEFVKWAIEEETKC